MTAPSLVSSLAVLFSISAIPWHPKHLKDDLIRRKGSTDLKVGDKLLDDGFPCDEPLDEHVRGTKVLGRDDLPDERLISGGGRPLLACPGDGRCAGRRLVVVVHLQVSPCDVTQGHTVPQRWHVPCNGAFCSWQPQSMRKG